MPFVGPVGSTRVALHLEVVVAVCNQLGGELVWHVAATLEFGTWNEQALSAFEQLILCLPGKWITGSVGFCSI